MRCQTKQTFQKHDTTTQLIKITGLRISPNNSLVLDLHSRASGMSTHKKGKPILTNQYQTIPPMTADLQQATIATYGHDEKPITSTTAPTSPPRKDASNPQQGMSDPATGSIGATTAATVSNTPCTSPLTVTSLEAAAAAGTAAANNANCVVPAVVSQVMAVPASVDGLLSTMAKLGLVSPLPPAASNNNAVGIPPPPPPMMEKMRLRTPPTEHDNRKLFVGGLPTDGMYVDTCRYVDIVTDDWESLFRWNFAFIASSVKINCYTPLSHEPCALPCFLFCSDGPWLP